MESVRRPLGLGWMWWGLLSAGLAVFAAALWWLIEVNAVSWLVLGNRWLAENVIARLGYLGVFALMLIESSFIPFPSEVVMPPAGDLARRLPDWSLGAVIVVGLLGSLCGALINYFLARYLGRRLLLALIDRAGRYVRITREGYEIAERMFERHGEISTFTARLLPGIRQIVSLPAGLAGMNLFTFCLLTSLGAGIWVTLLALLGYWFGSDPDLLAASLKTYSRWIMAGAVVLVGGYVVFYRLRNRARR